MGQAGSAAPTHREPDGWSNREGTPMPATEPHRNREEIARMGKDVYERQVKPLLRPEDTGKFVAVDIHTGAYEIDADDYTAVQRLRARLPTAEIWMMCAGFATAIRFRRAP